MIKKYSDYTEEEEHKYNERKNNWEYIKDLYGVELTVSEEMALSCYTSFFKKDLKISTIIVDDTHWFMREYFGLDDIELGSLDFPQLPDFKVKPYGLNLLGNKDFKEYCRRNVNRWREERSLI